MASAKTPRRNNSPPLPPPEWPEDPKQLVDIEFVKAALGLRSRNSVKKAQSNGILEKEVNWGFKGLRWRVEQVRDAQERMRLSKEDAERDDEN